MKFLSVLLTFLLFMPAVHVWGQTSTNQKQTQIESNAALIEAIKQTLAHNQQLWIQLKRGASEKQNKWTAIGEHLNLQQALRAAQDTKTDIIVIQENFESTYKEAGSNINLAYKQFIESTPLEMPPRTELDAVLNNVFSTSEEKAVAESKYAQLVKQAKIERQKQIDKIKAHENLQLAKLRVTFHNKQIEILSPFIERLKQTQKYRYLWPQEKIESILGIPDPDRARFPLSLKYKTRKWNTYWNYSGRKVAEELWRKKSEFVAKGFFQIIDKKNGEATPLLTVVEMSHAATAKPHRYTIQVVSPFAEESWLEDLKQNKLNKAVYEVEFARIVYEQGYRDKVTGMEFVPVPAGEFQMGNGDPDEKPIHNIKIDHFLMSKYEVTQDQWTSIMGENPSFFKEGGTYPVEQVSWNDIQEFLKKLNSRSSGKKVRLPTEAEWEYAARAGAQTDYFYGDDRYHLTTYAWYDENSNKRTHPAGQKVPNDWGLYDMHGNVWEWTCSEYLAYEDKKHTECISDGRVRNENKRTIRGGSWLNEAKGIRSANRFYGWPDGRFNNVGFRLVQD